jgi:hypothetical protein
MLKAARDVHDVPRPDLVDVASMGFSTRQSVTALLQRIANLAPKEIRLSVRKNQRSKGATVRLPRVDRTKSIVLNLSFFHLKLLLDDGDFPALERLVVEGCYFDAADMLHRCPHLRVLELRPFASLNSPVDLDLPVLEELVVVGHTYPRWDRFHILAPLLKRLSVSINVIDASVTAPNLEKLSLDCTRTKLDKIELRGMGKMQEVELYNVCGIAFPCAGDGVERLLQQLPQLHLLRIKVAMVSQLFLSCLCMLKYFLSIFQLDCRY